jgi:hypothetical protein
LASRVIRATFRHALQLRGAGDKCELVLLRNPPLVLCRVDAHAVFALEFVLRCDAFYVRELPGLRDDDRVALCRSLVELKVLGVAP